MSVPLVLLGFLQNRDYHGYELKKEIQRYMGNWTDIKFGSIYHALKKLVEHDYVEIVGEERQKGKPDRRIYRITSAGRSQFKRLLRELLLQHRRVFYDFDIGLYFAGRLTEAQRSKILTERLRKIQQERTLLANAKKLPVHRSIPRISEVIMDHSLSHLNAEINWLEACIARMRRENLYAIPSADSVQKRGKKR
jgi:DNA-binding PadR family transcriptional regulator